jgi:hypothetical protein
MLARVGSDVLGKLWHHPMVSRVLRIALFSRTRIRPVETLLVPGLGFRAPSPASSREDRASFLAAEFVLDLHPAIPHGLYRVLDFVALAPVFLLHTEPRGPARRQLELGPECVREWCVLQPFYVSKIYLNGPSTPRIP